MWGNIEEVSWSPFLLQSQWKCLLKPSWLFLCQIPENSSSSTWVCGILHIWVSPQMFRHLLEQIRVPSQYTSFHYYQNLQGALTQLWMRRAHLSLFLQKLTWSHLAQRGSKRYLHHHKGLQWSRIATLVSPTSARNSLETVDAGWQQCGSIPREEESMIQLRLPQLTLSSLGRTLSVLQVTKLWNMHLNREHVRYICSKKCSWPEASQLSARITTSLSALP